MVIFGAGRGYHTREVETFGVPLLDTEANRELFEEQFEVIMRALNEPAFPHQGKQYTIPPDVPCRGCQLKDITLCQEQLPCFAQEVMPAFKRSAAPAYSARITRTYDIAFTACRVVL